MAYLGTKVKEDDVNKVTEYLSSWLPKDEFIVAFFRANGLKPLTNMFVVTNRRLLAVYLNGIGKGKGIPIELLGDEIKDVHIKFISLVVMLKDNTKIKLGTIDDKDKEVILKVIKKISGSSVRLDIDEQENEKNRSNKNELKKQTESEKLRHIEAKEMVKQSALVEKEESKRLQEMQSTDTRYDTPSDTVIGKVNNASLREIQNSCRSGEIPAYILGDGINGVLAIFEDRCVVIKKWAMTSIMAGALGGGRTATFYYRDITGIEYNSGIISGVLEILTSSYSGKETNSPWTFGNDRSAHESSNTLPWGKIFYNQVRPQIELLKQKINESKHVQAPAAVQSTPDIAGEIGKLSDLHKQGILTDVEFQNAKSKILNKL